jgi:hypothetical protein
VRYEKVGHAYRLIADKTQFTTLERAVEGLTAGKPVSLELFEERLKAKVVTADIGTRSEPPDIATTS